MYSSRGKPVAFTGVSRFYEPGKDISVNISRAPNWTNAKQDDWVGIFPVGWQSLREFIAFLYVQLLDVIVFGGASLPSSLSDSFYQFVYMSADGRVLATSDPFQFQIPYDDVSLPPDEDSDEMVMLLSRMSTQDVGEIPQPGSQHHNKLHLSCPPLIPSFHPSESYCMEESTVILKQERDKYRKQYQLERRVSERQEEKHLELETKYCAALADNERLRKENEVHKVENVRVKEEVRAIQRDRVELDKEMKRLRGLVDDLSQQTHVQRKEIVIARPPPYCPPGDSISGDFVSSLQSARAGEAAASVDEEYFQCPVCNKKLPKAIGPTTYQLHVNMHFC